MIAWHECELFAAPAVHVVWYGREHVWQFKLPPDVASVVMPARGTKCESIDKLAAPGITGVGSSVVDSRISKARDGSYTLTVAIAEPMAF